MFRQDYDNPAACIYLPAACTSTSLREKQPQWLKAFCLSVQRTFDQLLLLWFWSLRTVHVRCVFSMTSNSCDRKSEDRLNRCSAGVAQSQNIERKPSSRAATTNLIPSTFLVTFIFLNEPPIRSSSARTNGPMEEIELFLTELQPQAKKKLCNPNQELYVFFVSSLVMFYFSRHNATMPVVRNDWI